MLTIPRCLPLLFLVAFACHADADTEVRVLNFQADSGFKHDSKDEALQMVEGLAEKNGWYVETSADPVFLDRLNHFNVVVFNNNCGTDKRIFSDRQHQALQDYIRAGGGFVGIHCAGAIWHEGGEFQTWYEKLIGTRLVSHPHVQPAKLVVEHTCHQCTVHLPKEWHVTDEWHKFSYNPREQVNVLISLDESTYEGNPSNKMGGDHPFTWYQYYDGGRSFFTSLGHTEDVYHNANFQRLVEAGIRWASGTTIPESVPVKNGLILDLNADLGVVADADDQVTSWTNQVSDFPARDFVPNDYGLRLQAVGSGRPRWGESDSRIGGHRVIQFQEDELINEEEDAFDHLLTGAGYTWLAVIQPTATANPKEKTEFGQHRLKDVNAFLGNLRNGGNYEGLWGCLNDDLTAWCGSRNGVTFGRFDDNNPKLVGSRLQAGTFHMVAARMGRGTGTVPLEIFVDSARPAGKVDIPVSTVANPSRMAIGTERDATDHPGSESFDGGLARVLIYERPLSDEELQQAVAHLRTEYRLGN